MRSGGRRGGQGASVTARCVKELPVPQGDRHPDTSPALREPSALTGRLWKRPLSQVYERRGRKKGKSGETENQLVAAQGQGWEQSVMDRF